MAAEAAPVFALAPALHGAEDFLDFSTSDGIKLYKAMRAPLSQKFDCSSKDLKVFLSAMGDKVEEFGWTNLVEIPQDLEDEDEDAPTRSLLLEYGRITIIDVLQHAATYVNEQTRQAQNSFAMYQCIKDSLTKEAQAKIMLKSHEYTIDGVKSGAALLKVVIQQAYLDSNATTLFIRMALTNLDDYMVKVDSDIKKFNDHVNDLVDSLSARGEATHDLLINLFKGYKACEDKEFVAFIKRKEDAYEDNHSNQTITPESLMESAKDKFDTLMTKGEWKAQTEEQKKIVALEAKVQTLTRNIGKNKGTKGDSDKDKGKGKGKGKDGEKKKKKQEKPKWMTVPPKDDDSKTKTVDGKSYHWCPNHEAWTRHKPSECQGKGFKKPEPKKEDEEKKSEGNKRGKLAQALASIAESDSDSK